MGMHMREELSSTLLFSLVALAALAYGLLVAGQPLQAPAAAEAAGLSACDDPGGCAPPDSDRTTATGSEA